MRFGCTFVRFECTFVRFECTLGPFIGTFMNALLGLKCKLEVRLNDAEPVTYEKSAKSEHGRGPRYFYRLGPLFIYRR